MSGPVEAVPDVSVIIPSYNYAAYLPEAVGSVLNQTFSALECIVVDDGSTDATEDTVSKITDARLRYVRQENGGLSSARNTGVRMARSRFVAFLDADDQWLPRFLERTLHEFASLGDDFGAVATASFRMQGNGVRLEDAHYTFGATRELKFRDFCLRSGPLASSVVVRREVFQEGEGFDRQLRSSEDRDFWLRMTARGWRFQFLDEPLAEIRRHATNMSKAARVMRVNRRCVLHRARRAGVIPRSSPFWLKVFSLHCLQSARAYHGQGMRLRATALVAASLALWPVFRDVAMLSERPLFRLRTLARIFVGERKKLGEV